MLFRSETGRGPLATARFAAPAPGRTIGLVFRSSSARADGYGQLAALLTKTASVAAPA